MNIENLLRAAFDFGPRISSSSIADQTKSSGQGRQDKYQDLLDAVIDARTRLSEIRKYNSLCYEILRLRYGLDKETLRISQQLEVPLEDVETLIEQALLYVGEKTNKIPELSQQFTKPERSSLERGMSIVILDGALAGTAGDFMQFEGSFEDRLIIRYFTGDKEQITIQSISDIDWY